MPVLRDQIIVIDIEATCWEKRGTPPGERSEIIEVGVALVDATTFAVSAPASLLVRPSVSRVSPFCTTLTTLTQELLDAEGISFAEACQRLVEQYDAPHRLWASWGSYDKTMFVEQCGWMQVPYPFSALHVNLKALFAEKENHRNRMGMAAALKYLELPLQGTHHRGGDDAHNIARILRVMLERHGLDLLKKHW